MIFHTAKESFQRLGFVLRNARDFHDPRVIRLLFTTLVRSKLEAGAVVWNPHHVTYTLMLEKVQKRFLRYLFKQMYGYYPYLYPTKFLLGQLGFNSLAVRRSLEQLSTCCKILRGNIDCPHLHNLLCALYVPNRYISHRPSRRHALFATPSSHTVARAQSPLCRSLTGLNAFLHANTECDMFCDKWNYIYKLLLTFCEKYATL